MWICIEKSKLWFCSRELLFLFKSSLFSNISKLFAYFAYVLSNKFGLFSKFTLLFQFSTFTIKWCPISSYTIVLTNEC